MMLTAARWSWWASMIDRHRKLWRKRFQFQTALIMSINDRTSTCKFVREGTPGFTLHQDDDELATPVYTCPTDTIHCAWHTILVTRSTADSWVSTIGAKCQHWQHELKGVLSISTKEENVLSFIVDCDNKNWITYCSLHTEQQALTILCRSKSKWGAILTF